MAQASTEPPLCPAEIQCSALCRGTEPSSLLPRGAHRFLIDAGQSTKATYTGCKQPIKWDGSLWKGERGLLNRGTPKIGQGRKTGLRWGDGAALCGELWESIWVQLPTCSPWFLRLRKVAGAGAGAAVVGRYQNLSLIMYAGALSNLLDTWLFPIQNRGTQTLLLWVLWMRIHFRQTSWS